MMTINALAKNYVQLGLTAGHHKAQLVDAFVGPADWQPQGTKEDYPLAVLAQQGAELTARLTQVTGADAQRLHWLQRHASSLRDNIAILEHAQSDPEGRNRLFSLTEETERLYDVTPTRIPESEYDESLRQLEALLPGTGDLAERWQAHKQRRSIDAETALRLLNDVICPHVENLAEAIYSHPPGNSFDLELVGGVTWKGYNVWKGGNHSQVMFNKDIPLEVPGLADTAAHETRPGHHTHHVAINEGLVKGKGWLEHTIDLFGVPWGVVAEGIAMSALSAVMDDEAWVDWHDQVVFDQAGLTFLDARRELGINKAIAVLKSISGNAAFMLFDDQTSPDEVQRYIQRYALSPDYEAKRRVTFAQKYGSYVFTYHTGVHLLRELFARDEGSLYWHRRLLTEPVTPSQVRAWIAEGPEGRPA